MTFCNLAIVFLFPGYIVEQGMTRQPYGGHKITEMLNSSLTERRYRFFTDVAFQLVRLGMEKVSTSNWTPTLSLLITAIIVFNMFVSRLNHSYLE